MTPESKKEVVAAAELANAENKDREAAIAALVAWARGSEAHTEVLMHLGADQALRNAEGSKRGSYKSAKKAEKRKARRRVSRKQYERHNEQIDAIFALRLPFKDAPALGDATIGDLARAQQWHSATAGAHSERAVFYGKVRQIMVRKKATKVRDACTAEMLENMMVVDDRLAA